ncbi:MAG: DUF3124 domain-containing protein [Cyanobacteria bacterium SZAS TMP-1]|nr:DUF3124 domain-containing protein [Cyanobacteria bacterium SZAS TMP-1]
MYRPRTFFAAFPSIIILALCLLILTSCAADTQPKIAPLESLQAHLQPFAAPAGFTPKISETVYVPVYSHIYHEDSTRATLLTGTLSIRNTDFKNGIILKSIAYYSTEGKLLSELCPRPLTLGPMASAEIVVPRTNTQGGSGANFVVQWMSEKPVSEPLVEAVMISSSSAQSVSFVSRGQVIARSDGAKTP